MHLTVLHELGYCLCLIPLPDMLIVYSIVLLCIGASLRVATIRMSGIVLARVHGYFID